MLFTLMSMALKFSFLRTNYISILFQSYIFMFKFVNELMLRDKGIWNAVLTCSLWRVYNNNNYKINGVFSCWNVNYFIVLGKRGHNTPFHYCNIGD